MQTMESEQEQQAQAIGRVVLVYGEAGTRNDAGVLTPLQAGDLLYLEDTIVTGRAAALSVALEDGSQLDFGPSTQARMDPEVFDLAFVADNTRQESATAVETTQAALVAGVDPSALEATAAGAEPGNEGGTDSVILDRSGQSVVPESGVDTDALEIHITVLPEQADIEDTSLAGVLAAVSGRPEAGALLPLVDILESA